MSEVFDVEVVVVVCIMQGKRERISFRSAAALQEQTPENSRKYFHWKVCYGCLLIHVPIAYVANVEIFNRINFSRLKHTHIPHRIFFTSLRIGSKPH